MNTLYITTSPLPSLAVADHARHLPRAAAHRAPRPREPIFTIDRESVVGRLSIVGDGPVRVVAEPGLAIRVHAGCLWVPDPAQQASVAVMAGESFTLRRGGSLLAMACHGVQIEAIWPSAAAAAAAVGLH